MLDYKNRKNIVIPKCLKYSSRFENGIIQPGSSAMALLQNMMARLKLPPAPEESAMNMLRADMLVLLFSDLECRL